jgi:hypothetical protein
MSRFQDGVLCGFIASVTAKFEPETWARVRGVLVDLAGAGNVPPEAVDLARRALAVTDAGLHSAGIPIPAEREPQARRAP